MERTEFDVIVIGSGAGGAPIASVVARKRRHVLVLDKGPLLRPQDEDVARPAPSDYKRDELFSTGPEKRITIDVANRGRGMFCSHIEPDLNDEPHIYREKDGRDYATIEGYTAQAVGGGTQLYGAVSLRFTELDFNLATFNAGRQLTKDPNGDVEREARNWPVAYTTFEKYYCRAEKAVGINGTQAGQAKRFSESDTYMEPLAPNPISAFARHGMAALGMDSYRTPLAVITRDHVPSGRRVPRDPSTGALIADSAKTGFVNRYGDPLGLKSNTYVSLLRPVLRDDAVREYLEIRPNCVVTHLSQQNGTIDRVHYLDPSGRPRSASAKTVVVACSAIESVRLLLLSADMDPAFARLLHDGRSPQDSLVGKYFLTHCFGGAEGQVPGVYDKSVSLDSDYATDFCAQPAFLKDKGLWAGAAIYNNTSDQALPVSLGRTHGSQDLDTIWKSYVDQDEITGAGFLEWLGENFGRGLSVSFMANQVPVRDNRIELHPTVRDKWNRPVAYIVKQWHGHDEHVMDALAEVCRDILAQGGVTDISRGGVYTADNARARIANHILGGLRFGDRRDDSVLDPDCKHWVFENLFVTDGSFMPTSGGANPTLTIEANAFRVADVL
jgi:choline dehydrogenase-like flavoprotein